MAELAIEATGLVKTFGSTRALDDFTLRVETGTVMGFLGPNGAGKSTAIRVLLGLLRADSGAAHVLGLDPWREAVQIHRRVAYVPGDTNLWPTLTGGETIDVLTRMHGHDEGRTAVRRRRAELIERFQLDPTKRARTYSKGNRQKVALIAALSSPAELFILDEPTSGLDPLMEAVFTDEIRLLREQGRTVLLSSHILAEVEKLCDTITIIRAGQDVERGTLAELRHLTRSVVTAHLDGLPTERDGALTEQGPGDAATVSAWAELGRHPAVHELVHHDHSGMRTLTFTVDDAAVASVLPVLHDLQVAQLSITPPSLEELFLRHYGAADHEGSGNAGNSSDRSAEEQPSQEQPAGEKSAGEPSR